MNFDEMSLHPAILKAVTLAGYTVPTGVQEQAIPAALKGSDILASAQTGTGKTAAFVLPALQLLSVASKVSGSKGPRILVLAPTRELAMQVTKAARDYGKFLNRVSVVSIIGGVPYQRQREQMSRTVEMMVATPGRLIDYMQRGKMDFSRIEMLVLDEADRMLDMGFRDAVQEISEALPNPHQTLLFSATIDESVHGLVKKLLKDPVRIQVSHQKEKHADIEQQLYYVQDLGDKKRMLFELLKKKELKQAIVFTATKRSADELTDALRDAGTEAEALHGDMRQRERTQTIKSLQDGKLKVIVATDVAARGINVPTITHVINFDIPREPQDYVHRIGRTGRAGAQGTAILLVYPKERRTVSFIESFIGHKIAALTMPGFEVNMKEADARPRSSGRGNFRSRGGRGPGGPRGGGFRGSRERSDSGSGDRRDRAPQSRNDSPARDSNAPAARTHRRPDNRDEKPRGDRGTGGAHRRPEGRDDKARTDRAPAGAGRSRGPGSDSRPRSGGPSRRPAGAGRRPARNSR
jgi:superfamily II DNA/RNA helicase